MRIFAFVVWICLSHATASFAEPDANDRYKIAVGQHILNFRKFPEDAKLRREHGTALVRFQLDSTGRVVSSSIKETSGSETLDKEALATVLRAQPYPAVPPGADQGDLDFTVPFVFHLKDAGSSLSPTAAASTEQKHQNSGPTPFGVIVTVRQLTKAEQIDAGIELMVRLKGAVADSNKERSAEAYKRIAIQSFKCAILYSMLSKSPPSGGANAVTFANFSDIFNQVSAFLYADSIPSYKSDVDAAQRDVLDIRKNNEKQKMFYLLRNCSELAEGEGKTLRNAISELMVK